MKKMRLIYLAMIWVCTFDIQAQTLNQSKQLIKQSIDNLLSNKDSITVKGFFEALGLSENEKLSRLKIGIILPIRRVNIANLKEIKTVELEWNPQLSENFIVILEKKDTLVSEICLNIKSAKSTFINFTKLPCGVINCSDGSCIGYVPCTSCHPSVSSLPLALLDEYTAIFIFYDTISEYTFLVTNRQQQKWKPFDNYEKVNMDKSKSYSFQELLLSLKSN